MQCFQWVARVLAVQMLVEDGAIIKGVHVVKNIKVYYIDTISTRLTYRSS